MVGAAADANRNRHARDIPDQPHPIPVRLRLTRAADAERGPELAIDPCLSLDVSNVRIGAGWSSKVGKVVGGIGDEADLEHHFDIGRFAFVNCVGKIS